MVKIINTSGKRKTAIARATLKAGKVWSGSTRYRLEAYGSDTTRMKIAEPILLVPTRFTALMLSINVPVAVSWTGRGSQDRARPRHHQVAQ